MRLLRESIRLGVPAINPGTRRLREYNGKAGWFKAAQRKAWAKAQDPERCAKIAAAKRGKPMPEPGTLTLTAIVTLGLAGFRRWRRTRQAFEAAFNADVG